jgi:hypothetical protein
MSTARLWIQDREINREERFIVSDYQNFVDEELCSLLQSGKRKPARVAA